jgi:hypothetical protein
MELGDRITQMESRFGSTPRREEGADMHNHSSHPGHPEPHDCAAARPVYAYTMHPDGRQAAG